jgi:hypothetical protein
MSLLPGSATPFDRIDLGACEHYPPTPQGLLPYPKAIRGEDGVAVPVKTWLEGRLAGERVGRAIWGDAHEFGRMLNGEMAYGGPDDIQSHPRPDSHELYWEPHTDRWFIRVSFGGLVPNPNRYFVQLYREEALYWLESNGHPSPYPETPHRDDEEAGRDRIAGAPTSVEAPAGKEERTSQAPRKRLKEPSPEAFEAYALYNASWDQMSVAKQLAKKLNRPTLGQGTISRWVAHVREWLGAGNPVPNPAPKTFSTDPTKIDRGPGRQNHAP